MTRNIAKYILINGAYLALTNDNVLIGFAKEVKPVARPPERVVERFE